MKVNRLHSINSSNVLFNKRQKRGEESSKSYQIEQNMSEMDENVDNLHNMGGLTLAVKTLKFDCATEHVFFITCVHG